VTFKFLIKFESYLDHLTFIFKIYLSVGYGTLVTYITSMW
jgi:hypothetical protein